MAIICDRKESINEFLQNMLEEDVDKSQFEEMYKSLYELTKHLKTCTKSGELCLESEISDFLNLNVFLDNERGKLTAYIKDTPRTILVHRVECDTNGNTTTACYEAKQKLFSYLFNVSYKSRGEEIKDSGKIAISELETTLPDYWPEILDKNTKHSDMIKE